MNRSKVVFLMLTLLCFAWVFLFPGASPASSSGLGITLTPTQEAPKATFTPVVPTRPASATLPPPPAQTDGGGGVIIPVTGSDKRASMDGVINLGLVLLGVGLVSAGFVVRKKE